MYVIFINFGSVVITNDIDPVIILLKGIDQFWSCDCIVKEALWNRSEKVDHLQ